jgi:hypothetical protein
MGTRKIGLCLSQTHFSNDLRKQADFTTDLAKSGREQWLMWCPPLAVVSDQPVMDFPPSAVVSEKPF